MRKAGEVNYAEVFDNGRGIVEYQRAEDVNESLRKLNGSKFQSFRVRNIFTRLFLGWILYVYEYNTVQSISSKWNLFLDTMDLDFSLTNFPTNILYCTFLFTNILYT